MSSINHREVASEVVERGYAIIRPPTIEPLFTEIELELERLLDQRVAPIRPTPFSGLRTTRHFDLLQQGQVWQEAAVQRDILEIAGIILGNDFLLSLLSTVLIQSGETAQQIHTDDDIYPIPRPHAPLVMNTIWAITDFTEENGATRVVPGSPAWTEPPLEGYDYETVPLIMERGSIGVILGTTYHGGGQNRSQHRRDGVIVNYCAGFLRQHENLMLGVSPKQVRGMQPTLKRLIGYRRTSSGLGILSRRAHRLAGNSSTD